MLKKGVVLFVLILLMFNLGFLISQENNFVADQKIDNDLDGYDKNADCNDANSNIYPGAVEIAGNNVDDDCDTVVDEEVIDESDLLKEIIEENKDVEETNAGITPGSNFYFIEGIFEKFRSDVANMRKKMAKYFSLSLILNEPATK